MMSKAVRLHGVREPKNGGKLVYCEADPTDRRSYKY